MNEETHLYSSIYTILSKQISNKNIYFEISSG